MPARPDPYGHGVHLAELLWALLAVCLLTAYLLAVLFVVDRVVRDPRQGAAARTGWVLVVILVPVFGLLAWWLVARATPS
jgi:hypothetical protein